MRTALPGLRDERTVHSVTQRLARRVAIAGLDRPQSACKSVNDHFSGDYQEMSLSRQGESDRSTSCGITRSRLLNSKNALTRGRQQRLGRLFDGRPPIALIATAPSCPPHSGLDQALQRGRIKASTPFHSRTD